MTRERNSSPARLAVVGAGAWGTVIALLLFRNGHQVTLWARSEEQARRMRERRENEVRLPGVPLPEGLAVTADLDAVVEGAQAAFLAVPSRAVPETSARLQGVPIVVSCSKGLAAPGLTRLSQRIALESPAAQVAVLSGPNLAGEIARGLPAASVVAAEDQAVGGSVQAWLHSASFRVYSSSDPTGAEVGGALKNVIALAAGMCDGLGLGENARASIVTRGLAELVRLGVELGARRETLYGLAGVGDLVATCSSTSSRNHQAGVRIAGGSSAAQLEAEGLTAEGIPTTRLVHGYAREQNIDMPITSAVHGVLYEGKDPRRAVGELMTRESRPEW